MYSFLACFWVVYLLLVHVFASEKASLYGELQSLAATALACGGILLLTKAIFIPKQQKKEEGQEEESSMTPSYLLDFPYDEESSEDVLQV